MEALRDNGEATLDDERYEFVHGLEFSSIVAASERVAWTVEGIFRNRQFDAAKPIVPASWLATQTLGFLDEHEQLMLTHGRPSSYVHRLGHFEAFVPPHLSGCAPQDWQADRAHSRALQRFGDEELKHQQLFSRAESVLEDSCGYAFGRFFD